MFDLSDLALLFLAAIGYLALRPGLLLDLLTALGLRDFFFPPSPIEEAAKEEQWIRETTATTGIDVIYLRDGSKIPASLLAMLQAKYSRDPGSVLRHVRDLEAATDKAAKFMADYYVGYGHRSIARCGNITLFIEGISMLAAMWLVHTPKFNGQECSTRYLNFALQGNVLGDLTAEEREKCQAVIDELLAFYEKAMPVQRAHFSNLHPRAEGVSQVTYDKTINAKAFDVLRAFLPCGMRTNVAITMNMCDFEDHVLNLMASPMLEVREVGRTMLEVLRQVEPQTFSRTPSAEVLAETRAEILALARTSPEEPPHGEVFSLDRGFFDLEISQPAKWEKMLAMMAATKPGHLVHRDFEAAARGRLSTKMDLGSFRDIHRHTSADHLMTKATVFDGFEQWYLDELAPELLDEAKSLISAVVSKYSSLMEDLRLGAPASEALDVGWELQYLIPLGFKVRVDMTAGMRSWAYIIYLRAGRMVHPTVRKVMRQIAVGLKDTIDLKVDVSDEVTVFDLKRGTQDIVSTKVEMSEGRTAKQ